MPENLAVIIFGGIVRNSLFKNLVNYYFSGVPVDAILNKVTLVVLKLTASFSMRCIHKLLITVLNFSCPFLSFREYIGALINDGLKIMDRQ